MTTFKIKPHAFRPGHAGVEIIDADGKLIATLYTLDDDERGVKLISRYIGSIDVEPTEIAVVRISMKRPP